MPVRGVRGATTAQSNTQEEIARATRELLVALKEANGFQPEDLASVHFAVTPDLDAAFPASAARAMGWTDAALLDSVAPRVAHDLARCIRVLIHWNTDRTQREVRHVYLNGAQQLRPDRAGGKG